MIEKVAIYTRLSSDNRERDEKVERLAGTHETQKEGCFKKAQELNFEVNKDYVLHETFTGTTLERPKLNQIVAGAEKGEFQHLILYSGDRLSRLTGETWRVLKWVSELKKLGVTLHYATEERGQGDFADIMDLFGYESSKMEMIRRTDRFARGKKRVAADGKLPQGTNKGIYGYDHNKKDHPDENLRRTRTINEKEAVVVKEIFILFASGHSSLKIAQKLNVKGIKPKKGGKWNPGVLRNMVKNTSYYGEMIYRKRKIIKDVTGVLPSRIEYRPEADHIIIPIPAIVDEKLFNKANKQLAKRSKKQTKRNHLLTGLITCKNCGGSIGGNISNPQGRLRKDGTRGPSKTYKYYRCRQSSPTDLMLGQGDNTRCTAYQTDYDLLNDLVWEHVKEVMTNPKAVLSAMKENTLSQRPTIIENLKVLKENLKITQNKKKKLDDMRLNDYINESEYVSRFNGIEQEKIEIVSTIADNQIKLDQISEVNLAGAELSEWIIDFKNTTNNMGTTEKRNIINALGYYIEIETLENKEQVINIFGEVPSRISTQSEIQEIKNELSVSNLKSVEMSMSPLHEHRHYYMNIARIRV